MATGYTHKILDGEITDFKSFALLCTRAFGATIHMRDDNLSTPYTPRQVGSHHKDSISRIIAEIKELKNMSDDEFEKSVEKVYADSIGYYNKQIESAKANFDVLSKMMEEAKAYEPPTEDHVKYKEFMVEQLRGTIDFDCNISYYIEQIETIKGKLESFNIDELRTEKLAELESSLEYHKKELQAEIQRVNDSNKWMGDVMKSLE